MILLTQAICKYGNIISSFILISIMVMFSCDSVPAQLAGTALGSLVSEEHPDAKTASTAKARAEKFLRDVADLAAALPTKEPNLLQAWPRSSYRLQRRIDTNEIVKTPLEMGGTVNDEIELDPLIWGNSWKVKYYGQNIVVNISQKNNKVVRFDDTSLQEAMSTEEPYSIGQSISQETAISRSVEYLKATGLDLNTISFDVAVFSPKYDENIGRNRIWLLYFKRVWNGIPYDYQGVQIFMEAKAGRLMILAIRNAVNSPSVVKIDIPASYPLSVLNKVLRAHQLRLLNPPELSLGILLPRYNINSKKNTIFNSVTNLCWVIRAEAAHYKQNDQYVEIWIDASSGEMLRFNINGYKGEAPPPSPSDKFLAILHTARQIEIQSISSNEAAPWKPIILDAEKDIVRFYSGMSGLRRGYTGPNGKPMPFTPTHLLTVTQAGNRKTVFRCDAATYQLEPVNGKPEERIQAGAGCQTWLGSSLYDRLKKTGN